jgi:hypothetical protein
MPGANAVRGKVATERDVADEGEQTADHKSGKLKPLKTKARKKCLRMSRAALLFGGQSQDGWSGLPFGNKCSTELAILLGHCTILYRQ